MVAVVVEFLTKAVELVAWLVLKKKFYGLYALLAKVCLKKESLK